MTGPHDLGGKTGHGPVEPEPDEPVFHDDWERRVFALTLAMGGTGQWNIDMSRHARERIPPDEYLSSTYYQIWLKALETLLVEAQLVGSDELASGKANETGAGRVKAVRAEQIPAILAKGGPADRAIDSEPRFAVGDVVKTGTQEQVGHTRLPAYAAQKVGQIAAIHGSHVFPDRSAAGEKDAIAWLYRVAFSANELWGDASPATTGDHVMLDLWEPYLEHT